MALTIAHLENDLAKIAAWNAEGRTDTPKYAYVETGRYKPFAESTVRAAERRGYRVEKACRGVYRVYPKATQYNAARIAWELERTALGDGFYGHALRVAKDMPGVTAEDRALLDRWATGAQVGTDHVGLQDLALRLYRAAIAIVNSI